MAELTVVLHVTAPNGRFVKAPELAAHPDLSQGLDNQPPGGLAITDDVFMVLVEDSLIDVAWFFLEELPPLLRAGKGGRYEFRTGPETVDVVVDGDDAIIAGSDGHEVETTVAALLKALEAAQQHYAVLERLLGL